MTNNIEKNLCKMAAFYANPPRDPDNPGKSEHPDKRAVAQALINTLLPRHREFMLAAVRNRAIREHHDITSEDLIFKTPARWEFSNVNVFGDVQSATCIAGRYRVAAGFVAVHPLLPDDPFPNHRCIPYQHKPHSPYAITYRRRSELKHQLGSRRSIVTRAWKMSLSEFLAQWRVRKGEDVSWESRKMNPQTRKFHPETVTKMKCMKDMTDAELLKRTGYTPEQFWREVHNPNTVTPLKPELRRPQLELILNE
jgi:hypothetical protein